MSRRTPVSGPARSLPARGHGPACIGGVRAPTRPLLGLVAVAVLAGCIGAGPAPPARADAPGADPEVTASELIDSVGVNVHESYLDSAYVDDDGPGPTLAAVQDLGVRRVRIGLAEQPRPYVSGFLAQLNRRGVRVLAVVGRPDGRWGTYATGDSAELQAALRDGYLRGRLSLLEMPNEWDANGGATWEPDLRAFTQEYVAAIEQVPGHPPIVAPSMARPQGYVASRLDRVADVANAHPYSGDQVPESDRVLPLWVDPARTAARTRTVIASEIGWHTAPHSPRAVSERIAGHYLIRSLIWNRTHGIDQSYVYELFDQQPDPAGSESELHYGLVAVSGDPAVRASWHQRPKPAYTELKALLARLRDGGRAPLQRVPYSVQDAPADLVTEPLLRRDGAMDLALWRKVALPAAQNGSAPARLTFDRPMRVEVYNAATGRTQLLAASTTDQAVQVSGVVRVVRIRPAG